MTRVRNFEDARFGEYLIKTWYYSPYPKPAPIEDRAISPIPPMLQPSGGHGQKRRKLDIKAESLVDTLLPPGATHSDGHANGNGMHKQGVGKGGLKKERSVQDIYAAGLGKADGTRGRIWVCDVSLPMAPLRARPEIWSADGG